MLGEQWLPLMEACQSLTEWRHVPSLPGLKENRSRKGDLTAMSFDKLAISLSLSFSRPAPRLSSSSHSLFLFLIPHSQLHFSSLLHFLLLFLLQRPTQIANTRFEIFFRGRPGHRRPGRCPSSAARWRGSGEFPRAHQAHSPAARLARFRR